eukprot:TRINITY_DN5034_c0_g1_i3.p1 TRINITY_DN5034_c0_g1~~TRINITY_DN5034_c0_g1_i3.p1  ORF type:complete len:233 (-),score=57.64 TRINITY_DN5034_c0_g1_i3:330-1028(-)
MSETDKSSHQSDGGSVALNDSLSFNEVAKLFSMPIAEAANILGVCTSVLKKICRDNGLIRWPYRKDSSKSQQGNIQMAGQASQQQGNRLLQNGRQNMFQSSQPKNIPTYLDEFKHGFPTNGLSSVSTKWWGTSGLDGNEMLEEEHLADEAEKLPFGESVEDMEASKVKTERETEKGDTGAALLLSLRKRASVEGREAVKLGVARGYGAYKLRRKERAMLFQIFRSSYPSEWE